MGSMQRVDGRQLYRLSGPRFELPFFVGHDGKLRTTPANDIPLLTWPDGHWCLPANLYMLTLCEKGRSRKNGGGTLKTYASSISHLMRFCYALGIDFINLTDDQFAEFITTLTKDRKGGRSQTLRRKSNRVIEIGRRCLDFLFSVGILFDDSKLIGPFGRIVAHQRDAEFEYVGRDGNRRKKVQQYWHHRSFPTPDPIKRRLPISTKNVEKLRSAVGPTSRSIFLRKRRYTMLKVLEITGGRRSEVAALTVKSVYEAAVMDEPKLEVLTAKRPGGRDDYRLIPIARHDLIFLIEFIEKNRRKIVRAKTGLDKDNGYVFISETTGCKLQPNTITQEIALLAKAAGISEQTCPHMFRHAYITKLFVALIEQHRLENVDDFRRALIDIEGMKAQILEFTGHKSTASLEPYIHMAFAEIANLKKTINLVGARRMLESFRSGIDQVLKDLNAGMRSREAADLMAKLGDAAINDLDMYAEACA